jgi:Tfp pilus assembly protein PilN
MRPINLIPPEDRRGEQAPLRTGPLPYILLGALVAVLLGVTALVLVGNQISASKAEVAKLEGEDAVASAQAQQLASYTAFRSMSEQRVATVQSLADSRFDWERVMRELALVLPSNVWLTGLTATASPEVSLEGGGGSAGGTLRAQVPGPALEMNGCASGQEAVAGFVTALKDIDGVTRVGVESSELGEEEDAEEAASTEAGANTGSTGDECRTRSFIAKFALVVAFDAAPVPSEESAESTVATPVETAESTASSESSSAESSESTEGE